MVTNEYLMNVFFFLTLIFLDYTKLAIKSTGGSAHLVAALNGFQVLCEDDFRKYCCGAHFVISVEYSTVEYYSRD